MTDFLTVMVEGSQARAAAQLAERDDGEWRRVAAAAPPAPAIRLDPRGFDLIAEIKLSSPSEGTLAPAATDVAARARCYAEAGACAVSVLTEPTRFGGDLAHLEIAAAALAGVGVPAMAKDFLVAPCQVAAARLAGAGGVLLILRILDDARLMEMLDLARSLGMFVLVEAFDAADLERARRLFSPAHAEAPPVLLGLNTRDLATLKVSPGRLEELADHFPPALPAVAESGLVQPVDTAAAAGQGYALGLVGTALMRAADPGAHLAALLEAGRGAVGGR
jgi:indole-3-glycerol phosphate synthase